MVRLVIFDEGVRGVDLPGQAVIIGRSRRVHVPIQDGLLSRKHCSIVPVDSGYCLWDLKSQNGTFLNGSRVDSSELHFEDVIEIGRTVMVFLDAVDLNAADIRWGRPEGLARLRNPVKAQKLIDRIAGDTRSPPAAGYPVTRVGSAAGSEDGHESPGALSTDEAAMAALEGELSRVLRGDVEPTPVLRELLENYLLHEFVRSVVRKSPALRDSMARVVRDLRADAFRDGVLDEDLRGRLREALTVATSAATSEGEPGSGSRGDGTGEEAAPDRSPG